MTIHTGPSRRRRRCADLERHCCGSRSTNGCDRNASIRGWLSDAGLIELDYLEFDQDQGERAALGSARYDGPPQTLATDQQLFTFWQ
jgi:hypothetical protein